MEWCVNLDAQAELIREIAVTRWQPRSAVDNEPDLVKVGKEGYIHGWICVRPPCGKAGDAVTHGTHGSGKITQNRNGELHAAFEDGTRGKLGRQKRIKIDDQAVAADDQRASEVARRVADADARTSAHKVRSKPAQAAAGNPPNSSGGVRLEDILPPDKAQRLLKLAKDSGKTEAVTREITALKAEACHNILKTKFGLSGAMLDGIAGDASKHFTQMSDVETTLKPLTWAGNEWSRYGVNSFIGKAFTRGMKMTEPPEVRNSDFAYTDDDKDLGWGTVTQRMFNDRSPEAQQRREDAMAYYGSRTQQAYTQAVLSQLKSKNAPLIRYVYGDYADKIADAQAAGRDWDAESADLTSWAQPRASAEKKILDFIDSQRFVKAKDSKIVKLSAQIPHEDVFMHWRTEGAFRNDGLYEVVPGVLGGTKISSADTIAEVIGD
jgi:hypothetical protein